MQLVKVLPVVFYVEWWSYLPGEQKKDRVITYPRFFPALKCLFFSLHSLYVHHSSNLNNYAMHARRNLYMASLSINQLWILPVQFLYDYLEDLQVRYELFLEVLLYCEQEDLYIHGLSL